MKKTNKKQNIHKISFINKIILAAIFIFIIYSIYNMINNNNNTSPNNTLSNDLQDLSSNEQKLLDPSNFDSLGNLLDEDIRNKEWEKRTLQELLDQL